MNTLPPIRRAVLVEAEPAAAFEVFTAGLGRWWPLGELSVHGKDATVAFDRPEPGAQIIERSAGGETAVWGTVIRWEPPDAVAFTWHPGRHADKAATSGPCRGPGGSGRRPGSRTRTTPAWRAAS